jgi:hypothetical protein
MTDIQKIIDMNNRLCLVLGYATAIISELAVGMPENRKDGYHWMMGAIENLLYLDKPLPPMRKK